MYQYKPECPAEHFVAIFKIMFTVRAHNNISSMSSVCVLLLQPDISLLVCQHKLECLLKMLVCCVQG